ncbi:MAG: CHAT domain-containing protein [Myxococcales bacterium]|nr:CHAT domain-containing protein [Myxococcales bacterium]
MTFELARVGLFCPQHVAAGPVFTKRLFSPNLPASRRGNRLGILSLTWMLLGTAACSSAIQDKPRTTSDPPPLLFGCDIRVSEQACAVSPDDPVCIWVPQTSSNRPSALLFTLDHQPLTTDVTPTSDGVRYCTTLPTSTGVLRVFTRWRPVPYLTQAIVSRRVCPELLSAKEAQKQGDFVRAVSLLNQQPDDGGICRVLGQGQLARLSLAQNDVSSAVSHFWAALILALHNGAVSAYLNDSTALAYTLTHREQDFGSARAVLAVAGILAGADPVGRVRWIYQSGLLAQKTGDFRLALQMLTDAALWAERLGLVAVEVHCAQQLGELLAQIGRTEDSRKWLDQAERRVQSLGSCEQARFYTNVGWSTYLSRAIDPQWQADPNPFFAKALQLHQTSCPGPSSLANAWLNRGLGYWQNARGTRADLAFVKQTLVEARQTGALSGEARDWSLWLEAMMALHDGMPHKARDTFRDMLTTVPAASELSYRVQIGLAHAYEDLSELAAADAAWAQAIDDIREGAKTIPLGEGRVGFLGRGLDAVVGRVVLAISQNRLDAALAIVLQSYQAGWNEVAISQRLNALSPTERDSLDRRLAYYRSLRRRETTLRANLHTAASDELLRLQTEIEVVSSQADGVLDTALGSVGKAVGLPPQPADNEVVLTVLPVESGYLLFGQTQETLSAWSYGVTVSGVEEASSLLAPLPADAKHTRVRLIPVGNVFRLPIHAWSYQGGTLLDRFHVLWSLGLTTDGDLVEPSDRPPKVVILGDSREDLSHARVEAMAMVDSARTAGVLTESLFGSDVTSAVFHRSLASATFLYVAGHGDRGGRDGLGASLWLTGNQQVDAGEILGQPRVPPLVVLSSCEGSADVSQHGFVPGLGMAQVFVMAGASRVVASPTQINDRCASIWATHFRDLRPWEGPDKMDDAYRTATLALRDTAPDCDWAMFRLLVR